jgi:hypothetical protein
MPRMWYEPASTDLRAVRVREPGRGCDPAQRDVLETRQDLAPEHLWIDWLRVLSFPRHRLSDPPRVRSPELHLRGRVRADVPTLGDGPFDGGTARGLEASDVLALRVEQALVAQVTVSRPPFEHDPARVARVGQSRRRACPSRLRVGLPNRRTTF